MYLDTITKSSDEFAIEIKIRMLELIYFNENLHTNRNLSVKLRV